MICMIKRGERVSVELETAFFACDTAGATLEWIVGVSWHGRAFFRIHGGDCLCFAPSRGA